MNKQLEKNIKDVVSIILEDKTLCDYLSHAGISKEDFLQGVTQLDTTIDKSKLTVDWYREMIMPSYDDNWLPDGNHCVVYHGGKTRNKPNAIHKHCGAMTEKCIVCNEDINTPEGKRIMRLYDMDMFDFERYREMKTISRHNFAKLKLKQRGETILRISDEKKKVAIAMSYRHRRGMVYYKEHSLVLEPRKAENGKNQYITVGIDDKNNGKIRKIRLAELRNLTDLAYVIFDINSVERDAVKYVNTKLFPPKP